MTMMDTMEWGHSLEAEQSVLGALLIDNGALDLIADVIAERDFYLGAHRRIFAAIARMVDTARVADLLTVSEYLEREDARVFSEMGGTRYLGELQQNVPSTLNVRRYAEIVRERSMARRLFQACTEVQESVVGRRGREVWEVVDQAEQKILAVSEGAAGRADFSNINEVMAGVFEFVDHQFHRQGDSVVTGVPTGFWTLDEQTTGMQGGELIILAARPGMGKSALSLNIAEHAALATGKPGLLFNLEMSNRQTGLRLLAAKAGINVQRLITGRLNDAEWTRASQAMSKLHDVPLLFNEEAGLSVREMRAMARRAFRAHGGLSVIVLDYLQLMHSGDSDANRANELAGITRGLKLLAKELSVPVLALSQLSRECEKRGNKRPVMSDLRDSGAIEQDADIVLFVYRDDYYNANSLDKGVAELIVSKQRNGPVGTVRLKFRADMTRFEDEFPRPEAKAA